jgi:hypothetical protein
MRTQKRARPSDDKSVADEHVLDVIAEVLPVVGVPEMVLEHLVGHDGLTDNDLKVLENRLGMTKGLSSLGCEMTLLGGVEHSFDDNPSHLNPVYLRWTRNGKEHRSHGPAVIHKMQGAQESQYYYHRGSLIGDRIYGWPMYYHDGSVIGCPQGQ